MSTPVSRLSQDQFGVVGAMDVAFGTTGGEDFQDYKKKTFMRAALGVAGAAAKLKGNSA